MCFFGFGIVKVAFIIVVDRGLNKLDLQFMMIFRFDSFKSKEVCS